jgi:hypothetical protein
MTTPMIDEARIAEKAYELWVAEGHPEGRQDEHWFRAIDALTVPVAKKPRRAPAAKVPAAASTAAPAEKPKRARAPKAAA